MIHFTLIIHLSFLLNMIYGEKQGATDFLKKYNTEIGELGFESSEAEWVKATNITDYNSYISEKASVAFTNIMKEIRKNASKISLENIDADSKRQLTMLLKTMTSSNPDVVKNISNLATLMETIYSVGVIPYNASIIKTIKVSSNTTTLSLNKYLYEIMAKSRNAEELLYVWKGWRDAVGPKLKKHYLEFVRLNNIGAREHKYADAGEYKRLRYEVTDLKDIAESFWNDLKPLYEELHAYVRHRLTHVYPHLVKDGEPIPAHLFGNMWAQSWENIFPLITPYPNEPTLDITPVLVEKGYSAVKMFQKAEEFFVSIGWQKLPKQFWNKSMIVQPDNRNVTCHASAWDFSVIRDGDKDVRVKMCTKINQDDFETIHHELGHIYYYLLYWNQSAEYRTGANPGFHEAVGDTIVLSVQTPAHLKSIGLLTNVSSSEEADINFLLKTATSKLAFLPFGYLMDQWMWGVYSGDIKASDTNSKWWEMRRKYQGIKPPIPRSENDFDPGAKYHIPANTPYIRYFFANILQFTFHKQACKVAGNTKPLHQCSIYNSKAAGKALGDMLRLGKSKKWPEALKQFTGSSKLSADPIKEYFKPLMKFLKKEREEKKYSVGWDLKPTPSPSSSNSIHMSYLVHVAIVVATTFLHI